MMLEGGSDINAAFRREDVIDELRLVVAPIAADAEDKPLFGHGRKLAYHLKEVREYGNSVVWMHYKRK